MSETLWGDKPYRSLNYELRRRFDEKVYKLALNGGMSCPNRDGTKGSTGCIFCSQGGSGDFAADSVADAKLRLSGKHTSGKYIAYFQSYSNTYASVSYLDKLFSAAIREPDIVMLAVATRPDCLGDDVLALLSRLNRIKPVMVELGLQTIHEETAALIRRGYSLSVFEEAVAKLHRQNIDVVAHMILGLPGESDQQVLNSISYLNRLPLHGVKLQLLHVLADTDLAVLYKQGSFQTMTLEAYTDLLIKCIERLNPAFTIHRITGDGPKNLLIAPLWSADKRSVLNHIHKQFSLQKTWQGRLYEKAADPV